MTIDSLYNNAKDWLWSKYDQASELLPTVLAVQEKTENLVTSVYTQVLQTPPLATASSIANKILAVVVPEAQAQTPLEETKNPTESQVAPLTTTITSDEPHDAKEANSRKNLAEQTFRTVIQCSNFIKNLTQSYSKSILNNVTFGTTSYNIYAKPWIENLLQVPQNLRRTNTNSQSATPTGLDSWATKKVAPMAKFDSLGSLLIYFNRTCNNLNQLYQISEDAHQNGILYVSYLGTELLASASAILAYGFTFRGHQVVTQQETALTNLARANKFSVVANGLMLIASALYYTNETQLPLEERNSAWLKQNLQQFGNAFKGIMVAGFSASDAKYLTQLADKATDSITKTRHLASAITAYDRTFNPSLAVLSGDVQHKLNKLLGNQTLLKLIISRQQALRLPGLVSLGGLSIGLHEDWQHLQNASSVNEQWAYISGLFSGFSGATSVGLITYAQALTPYSMLFLAGQSLLNGTQTALLDAESGEAIDHSSIWSTNLTNLASCWNLKNLATYPLVKASETIGGWVYEQAGGTEESNKEVIETGSSLSGLASGMYGVAKFGATKVALGGLILYGVVENFLNYQNEQERLAIALNQLTPEEQSRFYELDVLFNAVLVPFEAEEDLELLTLLISETKDYQKVLELTSWYFLNKTAVFKQNHLDPISQFEIQCNDLDKNRRIRLNKHFAGKIAHLEDSLVQLNGG